MSNPIRTLCATACALVLGLVVSPVSRAVALEGEVRVQAQLVEAMEDYQRLWSFNGAVAVSIGDEVLLSRGYGEANVEHGIANSADTPFRIASLSKQFTAAAILVLAAQGEIELDAPVADYLSQLDAGIGGAITVRQLLNHTSGLVRDVREMDPNRQDNDHFELTELIALINGTTLQSEPGVEFSYSNAGYNLAAAIIVSVTGERFGDALDRLLFDPLGMAHTAHTDVSSLLAGRAYPYFLINSERSNGAFFDPSSVIGGGSIATSVNDLVIWSQALQGSRPGLPDELREWMTEPQPSGYTLGWYSYAYTIEPGADADYSWLEPPANGWALSHSGVGGGFESYVRIYLDHGVTIAVLSNQTPGYSATIARALAAIILGQDVPAREALAWDEIQSVLFSDGVEAALDLNHALGEAEAFGLPGAEEMLRLVDMLLNARRLDDAVMAAEFFVGVMPEYKYAHALLGKAHQLAGDFGIAVLHYERALSLDPDDGMIIGWRDAAMAGEQ